MMLSQTFTEYSLSEWQPHPTSQDRTAWDSLSQTTRDRLIQHGEAALEYTWPPLLATRFLEVARIGNRANYERENFERRQMIVNLALAECAEGKGRFVDQLVNGIWLVCEESYWGVPAHLQMQAAGRGLPDTADVTVDLFAAETGAMLAYIYYLLGPQLDEVSPLIRPRIEREIDHRILTPNLERDDFGWMGFVDLGRRPNNWNPWINSNWLACLFLIEKDPARRKQSVDKIMLSLDQFIDPYPKDGGCDEGPNYWGRAGASLYDCLEILDQASDGSINAYDEPLVKEMGRFVYRTHIDGDYYVNFADASAIVDPDAALIYQYGKQIEDADMMAFGVWLAQRQGLLEGTAGGERHDTSPARSLMRELRTVFSLGDMDGKPAYPPMPRDVWLNEIEVMVARDKDRSADGFYVAAKGGHNQESHNHNDIGQFIVSLDGLPVLMDAGVETYSVKTFSDQRYEIWTMQSAYHNLPTIDGVMQDPGFAFAASEVSYAGSDEAAEFKLNIATAYPVEAGLNSWYRTVRLDRGQGMTITDTYDLNKDASEMTLSLLTASAVELSEAGKIKLSGLDLSNGQKSGSGTVSYDAGKFSPTVEAIDITDNRMYGSWGSRLYRIVLTTQNPPRQDTWTVTVTR